MHDFWIFLAGVLTGMWIIMWIGIRLNQKAVRVEQAEKIRLLRP